MPQQIGKFFWYPKAQHLPKPFPRAHEVAGKRGDAKLSIIQGDSQMLALKFIILVLGAGALFSLFAADFTPDFILAIVACLS